MVLDDVVEYEITPNGKRKNKLDQVLLNGNNVCLVRVFDLTHVMVILIHDIRPHS